MKLSSALKKLVVFNRYIFILDDKRLHNPLIEEERLLLESRGLLRLPGVADVIHDTLMEIELEPSTGMYFPVPIARDLQKGGVLGSEIIRRYHYDFIRVDERHQWFLRDKPISGKVLEFFKANLGFEPATSRYFIEYWSEIRWDKCYLECSITPMVVQKLSYLDGGFSVILNNSTSDEISAGTFRIDGNERCFADSNRHGEVMLADGPRYWLMSHLDDTGENIVLGKECFPVLFSSL